MIAKIIIKKIEKDKTYLDNRKDLILESLIKEYQRTGEPVASEVLNIRYDLGVSSATIRNYFVVLTEKGYLHKPYISSGRVPTDKAWKFFIEKIFTEEYDFLEQWEEAFLNQFSKISAKVAKKNQSLEKIKKIVELLSRKSHSFSFCYLIEEEEIIKQGLKYIFEEMLVEELVNLELLQEIVDSLENIDLKLKNIKIEQTPLVLIGKDNPLIKSDNFSSLLALVSQPKAIFGILGPKRMLYEKNIAILRALTNVNI